MSPRQSREPRPPRPPSIGQIGSITLKEKETNLKKNPLETIDSLPIIQRIQKIGMPFWKRKDDTRKESVHYDPENENDNTIVGKSMYGNQNIIQQQRVHVPVPNRKQSYDSQLSGIGVAAKGRQYRRRINSEKDIIKAEIVFEQSQSSPSPDSFYMSEKNLNQSEKYFNPKRSQKDNNTMTNALRSPLPNERIQANVFLPSNFGRSNIRRDVRKGRSNSLYSGFSVVDEEMEIDPVTQRVADLLSANKLSDLERFLLRREQLNKVNMRLIYFFHLFQTTGIFLTAVSTHYEGYTEIVLAGIFCNFLASIVNTYEHINNSISERTLADIVAIKDGTYVDERNVLDDQKI